ncbi:MAG: DUF4149 domain-containing protein [Verrucomicrobia bacterium]|nr:DUF4149 domain-containing protein [Verrucomicrobiota bacterium]
MITVLRFIGLANAAVWFGAAVCFTFFIGPGFFSGDMKALLGEGGYPFYSGAVAQIAIGRYFYLQYTCGAVAVAHLAAEWLYSGKKAERFTMLLLGVLLALVLTGGLILQPHMKQLQRVKYGLTPATPEQRVQAASSFKAWHAVSQTGNLVMLLGLVAYLWQASYPSSGPRFFSAQRMQ